MNTDKSKEGVVMPKYRMYIDPETKQRSKITVIDGVEGISGKYIAACSGCHETEDGHDVGHYATHPKHGIKMGGGCHECGYKGIRWYHFWVPINGPY